MIKWVEEDRTLICLESSEERMKKFVTEREGECACFVDEDLGDMMTAIAFGPIDKEEGKILFSDLRLA